MAKAQSGTSANQNAMTQEEKDAKFLADLESMNFGEMEEATSGYHKFKDVGEKIVGAFDGFDEIEMNDGAGGLKMVKVACLRTVNGRKSFGQTVIVGAIEEAKPELNEGDGVVIVYEGKKGSAPKLYDSFRVLFSRKA